ncbi:transporter substrate-binding domain-containing protein [Rhodoligotrophos ferricapiens]|uniref:transporter substrate-binding domain-containing protein n=1 Tax=Rhodoligotrophos ferricapiens TaxID=3069264 RepID=UPI00315C8AC9
MRMLFGAGLALLGFCVATVDAKEWTNVRIATEGAYAPWNFTKPNGDFDGYDIDVTKTVCSRMKVTCTIVAQDWDGMIPALNAGKFDAIVASMAPTEERRKVIAFTVSYALGPRSFVTTRSAPLGAIGEQDVTLDLEKAPGDVQRAVDALKPQLKGKTIGVQSATTHAAFMDRYFKGEVEVREYKSAEQLLLDLTAGRIDAAFDDMAFLTGQRDTPGGRDLVFFGPHFDGGLFGNGAAVALRQSDPELREKFDIALKSAIADGTLSALSMKWFKMDIAPKQ